MTVFICLLVSIILAYFISKYNYRLGLYFISFVFVAVMGFRNNITADYENYEILYNRIWTDYQLLGLSGMLGIHFAGDLLEPGYVLLNLLVYWLTAGSYRFFLIVNAIIIVIPLFKFFSKYPKSFFYTVALYLVVGTYFEGFNVMRQMMAASIATLSFQYIKDRRFIKYLGVILVASLFHMTSLLLVPIYFLFVHINKNRFLFRIQYLIIGLILFTNTTFFSQYFIGLMYEGSYDYEAGITSIALTNFLLPLSLLIFCESVKIVLPNYYRDSEFKRSVIPQYLMDYSIIETGMYIWLILGACTVQIPMITRFASLFSPFAMIYIAESLSGIKNSTSRVLIKLFFITILVLYQVLSLTSGSVYLNDYVFTLSF